jgi:fatty-acyl-CoA synthase
MIDSSLSQSAGHTNTPLLDIPIGAALRTAALKYPDSDAIVSLFQKQRYTYRQLDKAADEVAASLAALGVKAGDRVAIWSANCAEWLLAHHGAVRIGAIVVTVNPALRQSEAEYILGNSEASVVIAARRFRSYSFTDAIAAMRPNLSHLRELIFFGDEPIAGALNWHQFLALGTPSSAELAKNMEASVSCQDPCGLQYTSGTTGRPKGALLSHFGMLNNGFFVGEIQKFTSRDRICLPVPFFHCYGLGLGALAAVTHGTALILPEESFDTKSSLTAISSERCTAFYGVPMMYIAILNDPDFDRYDLKSLRTGCMGAAPCPTETMRQVISRMNMKDVTAVYGMTETSPISHQSLIGDDLEIVVSTVGTIHPHLEAKVIDPATGATLPIGEAGELCIRGYSVMKGYWRNPAATAEAIDSDGWMHSGDLAVMTKDRYVQIVGRIKDTVIRGGENIYPREIEEFLGTLPDVAEVYAFGVPDAKYGEEVCVWIRLKPGRTSTAEKIQAQCKGQVATYKVPRYVRIVDEFPATASGKVQRFKMRETEIDRLKSTRQTPLAS